MYYIRANEKRLMILDNELVPVSKILTGQSKCSNNLDGFKLGSFESVIGDYTLTGYGIYSTVDVDNSRDISDYIVKVLDLSEEEYKASLEGQNGELIRDCRDAVEFCCSIENPADLVLPEGVVSELKLSPPTFKEPEIPKDVVYTSGNIVLKSPYAFKPMENSSLFQKNESDELRIALDPISRIHSNDMNAIHEFSEKRILRALAPYRVSTGKNSVMYFPALHTPYCKAEIRYNANLPTKLEGYAYNNSTGILSNETTMYENIIKFLKTSAAYVSDYIDGLICNRPDVQPLRHILTFKGETDNLRELVNEFISIKPEGLIFNCDVDEITRLHENNSMSKVYEYIENNTFVSDELIYSTINDYNLKIVPRGFISLKFNENIAQSVMEKIIDSGLLYTSTFNYICSAICAAYRVNWGFNGAVNALTLVATPERFQSFQEKFQKYIKDALEDNIDNSKYPELFDSKDTALDDELAEFDDDSDDSDDATLFDLNKYLPVSVLNLIKLGDTDISINNFPMPREGTKEYLICRWRVCHAEANLQNFISAIFNETGDITIFAEAFVKLCRWGGNKMTCLVLSNYRDNVFNLEEGYVQPSDVIDASVEVAKVNGCHYALKSFATVSDMPNVNANTIVGFILTKSYENGESRDYLATWTDMWNELNGDKDVNFFVTNMNLSAVSKVNLSSTSNDRLSVFVSSETQKQALERKITPEKLSAASLLFVNKIFTNTAYIDFLRSRQVVTESDVQYDALYNYTRKMQVFERKCSQEIKDSANLLELIKSYGSVVENQQVKSIDEENRDSLLSKLNFNNELHGKYILIHDIKRVSGRNPIVFSDSKMKLVSDKLKNCVVALLCVNDTDIKICVRNDIKYDDIKIIDGKRAHKDYSIVASLIEQLKAGKSATYLDKPVSIHKSFGV